MAQPKNIFLRFLVRNFCPKFYFSKLFKVLKKYFRNINSFMHFQVGPLLVQPRVSSTEKYFIFRPHYLAAWKEWKSSASKSSIMKSYWYYSIILWTMNIPMQFYLRFWLATSKFAGLWLAQNFFLCSHWLKLVVVTLWQYLSLTRKNERKMKRTMTEIIFLKSKPFVCISEKC